MTVFLTPDDFAPDDFIMLRPALVRKMNGNVVGAMILTRISYRCGAQNADDDGHKWWKTNLVDLSDEVGLSDRQVRRAVTTLLNKNYLVSKVDNQNGYDRTKSYRVNVLTSQQPKSADGSAESGGSKRPDRLIDPHDPADPLFTQTENKTTTKRKTQPRASRSEFTAMADAHFDEWYKTYPLNKGRGPARTAYVAALKKISTEDDRVKSGQETAVGILLAAARVYQNDLRVKSGYIKEPATWLKEERWDDEPTPAVKAGAPRGEGVEFNGVVVSQRSADALEALQRVHEQDDIGALFADWDAQHAPRELEGRPW